MFLLRSRRLRRNSIYDFLRSPSPPPYPSTDHSHSPTRRNRNVRFRDVTRSVFFRRRSEFERLSGVPPTGPTRRSDLDRSRFEHDDASARHTHHREIFIRRLCVRRREDRQNAHRTWTGSRSVVTTIPFGPVKKTQTRVVVYRSSNLGRIARARRLPRRRHASRAINNNNQRRR